MRSPGLAAYGLFIVTGLFVPVAAVIGYLVIALFFLLPGARTQVATSPLAVVRRSQPVRARRQVPVSGPRPRPAPGARQRTPRALSGLRGDGTGR
jgi:hypothetical protein